MARSTVFHYQGRAGGSTADGRTGAGRAGCADRTAAIGRKKERIVMRAELVDATDGSQLWGGQLQRDPPADVLALQEDLAQEARRSSCGSGSRVTERHAPAQTAHRRIRACMKHMHGLLPAGQADIGRILEGDRTLRARRSWPWTRRTRWHMPGLASTSLHASIGAAAYIESSTGRRSRKCEGKRRNGRSVPDERRFRRGPLGARVREVSGSTGTGRRPKPRSSEPARDQSRQRRGTPSIRPAARLARTGTMSGDRRNPARARTGIRLSLMIIGTVHGRVLHFTPAATRQTPSCSCRHTPRRSTRLSRRRTSTSACAHRASWGTFAEAITEIEPFLEGADRRSVMLAVLGHICAMAGQNRTAHPRDFCA